MSPYVSEINSLPLQERISFRLQKIGTLLTVQAGSILKTSGNLTLNQWRLLTFLNERKEGSVSELIRMSALDKATMSRTVADLTKRGLIEAKVSAQDRRSTKLTLTALGREHLALTEPAMKQRQIDLIEALTQEERATLFRVLDKLERVITKPDKET